MKTSPGRKPSQCLSGFSWWQSIIQVYKWSISTSILSIKLIKAPDFSEENRLKAIWKCSPGVCTQECCLTPAGEILKPYEYQSEDKRIERSLLCHRRLLRRVPFVMYDNLLSGKWVSLPKSLLNYSTITIMWRLWEGTHRAHSPRRVISQSRFLLCVMLSEHSHSLKSGCFIDKSLGVLKNRKPCVGYKYIRETCRLATWPGGVWRQPILVKRHSGTSQAQGPYIFVWPCSNWSTFHM